MTCRGNELVLGHRFWSSSVTTAVEHALLRVANKVTDWPPRCGYVIWLPHWHWVTLIIKSFTYFTCFPASSAESAPSFSSGILHFFVVCNKCFQRDVHRSQQTLCSHASRTTTYSVQNTAGTISCPFVLLLFNLGQVRVHWTLALLHG